MPEEIEENENEAVCSICSCDFDLEGEGGIRGNIGILPMALCPTCYNGMMDMAEQLGSNASIECPDCGEEIKLRVDRV